MTTIPNRYLYIFFSIISILAVLTILKYPGQAYIYIIFTLTANVLLYFGVRKNAIFFDTFVAAFLWLGFWLKASFRIAFLEGRFHEPVGFYMGSGSDLDQALLIASCAFMGLITISFIREKIFFNYPKTLLPGAEGGLFIFYKKNRKLILSTFVIFFILVALSNFYFGIYQKGSIPRTVLPYGLGGIYKWLLLFGMASFSAIIIRFEFTLNKKTSFLPMGLAIAESTAGSVSLLSRGMILNTGALLYGVIHAIRFYKLKVSKHFFIILTSAVCVLFFSSVLFVNQLRHVAHDMLVEEDVLIEKDIQIDKNVQIKNNTLAKSNTKNNSSLKPDDNVFSLGVFDSQRVSDSTKVLFLDRWVGIEGVLAVSTYKNKGWDLWNNAWKERFSFNNTSFYDNNIIVSAYLYTDKTKYHYISLPGIIAFCFYPGSFIFLFMCMVIIGAIGAAIEFAVYKLGNKNIILCALLSQVVAYRYAHFGYVPTQSYLLFGALFLNLFIIYFSDKFLMYWYKGRDKI